MRRSILGLLTLSSSHPVTEQRDKCITWSHHLSVQCWKIFIFLFFFHHLIIIVIIIIFKTILGLWPLLSLSHNSQRYIQHCCNFLLLIFQYIDINISPIRLHQITCIPVLFTIIKLCFDTSSHLFLHYFVVQGACVVLNVTQTLRAHRSLYTQYTKYE